MIDFVVCVSEQVSETHDGILTILDKERLGTVTDVDLLARVRDGTCDLSLAFFIGDTFGVAILCVSTILVKDWLWWGDGPTSFD